MILKSKTRFPAMIVGCALFWSSCGDDSGKQSQTKGSETPSYSDVWKESLSHCGRSCHQPGINPDGGPDFSTRDLFYQNTVGKRPENNSSDFWNKLPVACRSLPFISPGQPERSLVAGVLNKEAQIRTEELFHCRPSFSSHTGHAGHPDEAKQARILAWIKAGAPDN